MDSHITFRPIATPLPLGFLALTVATTVFSTVQLGWIPVSQDQIAALAALLFAMPLQLVASVFGFLSRDPVAGTGLGVLAGTWAVVGVSTLAGAPGASSPGLGVVLLVAGAVLLVPSIAGISKPVAAAVLLVSVARFVTTGVAELTGSPAWRPVAGVTGLVLAALALYAAAAFELEAVRGRSVLPLARRGKARAAMHGEPEDQLEQVEHEAGVRRQL